MKIIAKNGPLFKIANKHHLTGEDELVEQEQHEVLNKVFAFLYILFISLITIAVLLELKTAYQIDLFPGINTPFDDVYFKMKGDMLNE